MRLASWNVNGIRSVLKKGDLAAFVRHYDLTILCLQETRCPGGKTCVETLDSTFASSISSVFPYRCWNHGERPGYSGTATFSKIPPIRQFKGLTPLPHGQEEGYVPQDTEGRVLTSEFQHFYLVNVYVPNSKRTLERLPYREKEWDPMLLNLCVELNKKKPVILCGDLNVSHTPMDLAHPAQNEGTVGYTREERSGFSKLLNAGFVDTFRYFHPKSQNYTWWSNFQNCRSRNIGWRLDYFLVSNSLIRRTSSGGSGTPPLYCSSAVILPNIKGSDHCPVALELQLRKV